jgi:hypothetical protein
MRKGVLLGIIAGVLGIGALFLNFVTLENLAGEKMGLSFNSLKSEPFVGPQANEAASIIFNIFLVLSLGIALFSFLSNRKNLLGILTAIFSVSHFAFAYLFYSTGNENINLGGNVNFGMGMYLVLISGVLGLVGAVLAIMKK